MPLEPGASEYVIEALPRHARLERGVLVDARGHHDREFLDRVRGARGL